MMNQESIYQHFSPDEHQFIEKLGDLVDRLENQYTCQLTGFLDPRQVAIARSVLGQAGLVYYVSSDYHPMEYARILLAPDYYELDWMDFELSLLEVRYQGKFAQLSHSQILGSLLNGLGIKRQVVGDILVHDGYAQVIVDSKMTAFILANTVKMAKTGVQLKELTWSELRPAPQAGTSELVLLSSLRLDKLVAVAYKLSRQQAQALIEGAKVKLNYQVVVKPDQQVQVGDLISSRGFGRLRLTEDLGLTKNQKHKMMIEKTIKR